MNKLALLFPGQGSQYSGMGKEWLDQRREAALVFEEVGDLSGVDVKKLCLEGGAGLDSTRSTQLAVFTASVAMFKVYESQIGILPAAAAGHSLGEYSALTCAGSLAFADAVRLIAKRGQFMEEACAEVKGGMAAVIGVSHLVVEEICDMISEPDNYVRPSNYNTPSQTVISGHRKKLDEALEVLGSRGIQYKRLNVSIPAHSPLLAHAKERMAEEMRPLAISMPKWDIISNVTATPYRSIEEIRLALPEQIISPVRWSETMTLMKKMGITIAVEMGPKTVLKNVLHNSIQSIRSLAFDIADDRSRLLQYIGNDLYRQDAANFISLCMGAAVSVRNKNFNEKEYHEGVVIPYIEMQKMQTKFEGGSFTPNGDEKRKALQYLRGILETKKYPQDKINHKLERINV